MEALVPYLPPALLPLVEQTVQQLQNQCHTFRLAVLSLAAVLLGYLFIAGSKEAPVTFNVPHPPEIEDNWTGTKWEDLPKGSQERRVIEGQISGVSFVSGSLARALKDPSPTISSLNSFNRVSRGGANVTFFF
jgi:hypothetical protein